MIISYITFQSKKVVIFISICSLIMWTNVRQRSCIFNNEIILVVQKLSQVILMYPKVNLEKANHNTFGGNIRNFGFLGFGSSSWNIRKIRFLKYKNLFWCFCFLKYKKRILLRKYKKVPFLQIQGIFLGVDCFFFLFLSLGWKLQDSISGNIKKAFFWENTISFLMLELGSSISWNIRKFAWGGFFFELWFKRFISWNIFEVSISWNISNFPGGFHSPKYNKK